MNKVILMGRLTRDPETRYSQGERATAVTRYSLAVNRTYKREGDPDADFINCVCFGRQAEFAEKYLKKGTRMVVTGRIQTGSYTYRDGVKVYTTDIIVEDQEFAESKAASERNNNSDFGGGYNNNYNGGYQSSARTAPSQAPHDGFMNIPDGIDEELPFS